MVMNGSFVAGLMVNEDTSHGRCVKQVRVRTRTGTGGVHAVLQRRRESDGCRNLHQSAVFGITMSNSHLNQDAFGAHLSPHKRHGTAA